MSFVNYFYILYVKGYDYKNGILQKWYKQASYNAIDKIPIVYIYFIMKFNTIDKKKVNVYTKNEYISF